MDQQHASKRNKHFLKKSKTTFDCVSCHIPHENGTSMLTRNFQNTCAECHKRQIVADAHPVLVIPALDLDSLEEREVEIGDWPEEGIEGLSPFLRLMLIAQPQLNESLTLVDEIEDLYEMIGAGKVTAYAVIKRIYPEFDYKSPKKFEIQSDNSIRLKGLTAGMSYHLAGCCSPIKGDNIVGIVTAGIGVAVHTIDCETLSSYSDNPERWLNISWDYSSQNTTISNARITVVLKNQPGSLGKVTTVIAKNNGNISNINFSIRKTDFFEIIIDIEVRDANHLKNIIAALRLVSEVSSLERIKG